MTLVRARNRDTVPLNKELHNMTINIKSRFSLNYSDWESGTG